MKQSSCFGNFYLLCGLTLPHLSALAQSEAVIDGAHNESTMSLWSLVQQGGWAMYPLGLCSIVMLFLIAYSARELRRKQFYSPSSIQQAKALIQTQDLENASALLGEEDTLLSRSVGPSLAKLDRSFARAEDTFVERLDAEENGVAQWINYLNVVASVAPMIGLLGTVSGMVSAFQTIGRGGMGRPELLAGDIGEALITTATGLVIGIPAMIAYFVLKNRLNTIMIETSQHGSDLLDGYPNKAEEAAKLGRLY